MKETEKKGLKDKLTFGKWKGETVETILNLDPGYLIWVSDNVKWFPIKKKIVDEAIEEAFHREMKRYLRRGQRYHSYYVDESSWLDMGYFVPH